ncbi:ribonuclease H-like domain-containing protein [Tanacetum coccineum]
MAEQDTPPPTITAMKIPIIKKGEYDIWSMRMRQYICHTDHNLWDVIVNGDLEEKSTPTGETFAPLAPKTAKQLAARRNQERVKSILLLAILDEYLLKFHNIADAKFPAGKVIIIVSTGRLSLVPTGRILSPGRSEGSRASSQTLTSKHMDWFTAGFVVPTGLLTISSASIVRYGSTDALGSWMILMLMAWLLLIVLSKFATTPCAHDVACHPFFAQPTTSPQLENEDFQQIDEDDLEELDLRWQVAMLTVRVKKFIQKTGRNLDFKEKRHVSLDKSKIKCYNCHRKGHFARDCRSGRNQGKRSYGDNGRSNAPTNESSSQALVAQDGLGGYDWSNDFEVEPVNYALMAISSSSSSSSSDKEVQNCSKQCLESFKTLQKNYDSEREKHSRARLEIQGYELALESLESRILVHEKNELAWGEKYEFQNYELKCREIKINNLNLELEKVVKERDELKLKIEKWEESSKNLDELLNSQMSARDKTGLGYGTQLNEMSNNSKTDSEISLSVFYVRSSDEESTLANDRFSKADGFHAIPPPITGNFLTPRADISFAGLDEYAIRKKIIKSKTTNLNTKTSKTVGKTNKANTQKSKTVYESVHRDKVIIEDWNSDDEDDVSEVQTVSPVKTNETQTNELNFKLLDESQVVLRAPRKDDVYSLDLKNIVPSGDLVRNKREFSVARTPQQNGVVERKNRTLIEAARTMLADSLLPIPFWAETVNTACYVLNRVLVTKPQNKTPYELLIGNLPSISFMRPFGCPLTILNTLDFLGKFDGKSDEGYLFGYSTTSKAFRVYNKRTKRVEENLHIDFLEDQPNVAGIGLDWMFDLDFLTNTMNYILVSIENQVNMDAGTQDSYVAGSSGTDKEPTQKYILLPLHPQKTRIPVKDVVQDAQEKPSENASPDKDV